MAAAVNAFVTDPMLKTVSGVFGVSASRSASPYPARHSNSPPAEMATVPLNPASAHALNARSSAGSQSGLAAGASACGSGVSTSSLQPVTSAAAASRIPNDLFMAANVRTPL
jgi:hypothetical protein